MAKWSYRVDNAFLVSLVGMRPEKHFWIGLSNQKNIEKFVWTNKDKVAFTNWNVLMPGIGGGGGRGAVKATNSRYLNLLNNPIFFFFLPQAIIEVALP